MIGIILAVIWLGMGVASGAAVESVFLSAAGFLYSWYWFWAVVLGILVTVFFLAPLVAIGSSIGFLAPESPVGKLVGLCVGFTSTGTLSLMLAGRFIFRRALLIIGAYALMTSGCAFLPVMLGIIFLAVGVMWGKK